MPTDSQRLAQAVARLNRRLRQERQSDLTATQLSVLGSVRVLGRAPDEFERRREDGRCSGAGGLLPVTMPGVARGIAEQRLADHERSGGGTIVTACASSARSFQKGGHDAVLDLATVVLRALDAADAARDRR